MVLNVVKARPQLMSIPQSCTAKSIRLAIAISSKVSKRAVVRNRLRRVLHDHLKEKLGKTKEYASFWALISLKPSSSTKGTTPLLEECDRLLFDAGLVS